MRHLSGILSLLLMLLSVTVHAEEGKVCVIDFDAPAIKEAVAKCPYARIEKDTEHLWVLVVEVPQGQKPGINGLVSIPFDLTGLGFAGRTVYAQADVRVDGVSAPEKRFMGAKFMMYYTTPDGSKNYPEFFDLASARHGTCDWYLTQGTTSFPNKITESSLRLGLQGCHGKVMYKNIRFVTGKKLPQSLFSLPPEQIRKVKYTTELPRLRGFMSPNAAGGPKEKDFAAMAELGANCIRWQMNLRPGKGALLTLEEAKAQCEEHFRTFADVLKLAEKYHLYIIADLHPIGMYGGRRIMTGNAAGRAYILDFWERFVKRYHGHPNLCAYDLLNEPNSAEIKTFGEQTPHELYAELIRRIRKIDPTTMIIVESDTNASPYTVEYLPVYDADNVIYSFHMYKPLDITHQLDWRKKPYIPYPCPEKGWDFAFVKKQVDAGRKFQQLTGARIFIGEFSCLRWVPGAAQYLRDCIKIFEEYGWDWTYHAFREWDGWSIEMGEDPTDKTIIPMSDRKQALMDGFKPNVKP